jgi:hypothetical protein
MLPNNPSISPLIFRHNQQLTLPVSCSYSLKSWFFVVANTTCQRLNPSPRICIEEICQREAFFGREVYDAVNSAAENFITNTLKKISDIDNDGSWFWRNGNKGPVSVKYLECGG